MIDMPNLSDFSTSESQITKSVDFDYWKTHRVVTQLYAFDPDDFFNVGTYTKFHLEFSCLDLMRIYHD